MNRLSRIFIIVTLFLFLSVITLKIYSSNLLPTESFVLYESKIVEKNSDQVEISGVVQSSSGVIVFKDNGKSYILTAGHSCDMDQKSSTLATVETKNQVINYNFETFDAEILTFQLDVDLCLLESNNDVGKPIRLSRIPPKRGDRVYNIAAPYALFEPNFILIFEGIYSGRSLNMDMDIYTIPIGSGSSGSPVLNSRGELIGIVSASFPLMENFAIVVPLREIRNFIEESKTRLLSPGDEDDSSSPD